MEWTDVDGLSLEDARSLVGVTIRWRTPRRRVSPGEFSNVREGVLVWALPRGHWPNTCPEVKQAPSSHCQFSVYGGSTSDRVIVRVDRTQAKTGKPLPSNYYATRLSSVIAVSRVEQDG